MNGHIYYLIIMFFIEPFMPIKNEYTYRKICTAYRRIQLPYHKIPNLIISQLRYVSIFLCIVSYRRIRIAYRRMLTTMDMVVR